VVLRVVLQRPRGRAEQPAGQQQQRRRQQQGVLVGRLGGGRRPRDRRGRHVGGRHLARTPAAEGRSRGDSSPSCSSILSVAAEDRGDTCYGGSQPQGDQGDQVQRRRHLQEKEAHVHPPAGLSVAHRRHR
jgi:hypothetical protein